MYSCCHDLPDSKTGAGFPALSRALKLRGFQETCELVVLGRFRIRHAGICSSSGWPARFRAHDLED